MPKLFLDCDGVLADFDAGARDVLGGMTPAQYQSRHSRGSFWKALAAAPDFYNSLPLMSDAQALFDAVEHLGPTILTGLPMGKWAEPQKRAWAARHFPGLPVITCFARDKHRHGLEGDVLVDDSLRLAEAWQSMGGTFVHHANADASLKELAEIFPSSRG